MKRIHNHLTIKIKQQAKEGHIKHLESLQIAHGWVHSDQHMNGGTTSILSTKAFSKKRSEPTRLDPFRPNPTLHIETKLDLTRHVQTSHDSVLNKYCDLIFLLVMNFSEQFLGYLKEGILNTIHVLEC